MNNYNTYAQNSLIVLLLSQLPCFLLMTKGEKYMSINAMLASPRDIWIDAMIAIICIMPCLYHVMISKSYSAVLHVDILQYDELLLSPLFKPIM